MKVLRVRRVQILNFPAESYVQSADVKRLAMAAAAAVTKKRRENVAV